MTHNELASKLAERLRDPRRMVWENMAMGPAPSPRPDVYTLNKSFVNPSPRTYEIKVSVSDFRSDITSGKWMNYLEFSCAVTFVTPAGMVKKADIPNGCGFMTLSERGWATIKKPILQTCELPRELLFKLLIDSHDERRRSTISRLASEWVVAEKHRKKIGKRVADIMLDEVAAERAIKSVRQEAETIIARARERVQVMNADAGQAVQGALREVCEALGVSLDTGAANLAWDIRKRLRRLDRDGEVATLRRALADVRKALDNAENPMLNAVQS